MILINMFFHRRLTLIHSVCYKSFRMNIKCVLGKTIYLKKMRKLIKWKLLPIYFVDDIKGCVLKQMICHSGFCVGQL